MRIDLLHNRIVADCISPRFKECFENILVPMLSDFNPEIEGVLMYEDYLASNLALEGEWYYPLTVFVADEPRTQWIKWRVGDGFRGGCPYSYYGAEDIEFAIVSCVPDEFKTVTEGRAISYPDGCIRIRVVGVKKDPAFLVGRYSQTFVDEMARQISDELIRKLSLEPTHNTIVEFGIMNSIPNMTMVAPCDANQCAKLIEASLTYPGPMYIRIPRGEEPAVYNEDYEYVIGKAIEVKDGKDATIIATGSGVYNSLQAALHLQEKGMDVAVVDMHTIKPIDKDAIIKAAKTTGTIITVEDHNVLGGLGSIVADVLMEAGVPARLKKIGVQDEFISLGYPEEIYPYLGFDAAGIAKTVEEFCK